MFRLSSCSISEGDFNKSLDFYDKFLESGELSKEVQMKNFKFPKRKEKALVCRRSSAEDIKTRFSPIFKEVQAEKDKQQAPADRSGIQVCTKCNFESSLSQHFKKTSWVTHALTHFDIGQFRCEPCSFRCRFEDEMRLHQRDVHEYTDRYLPRECTNFEYTKEEIRVIDRKARECFPDYGLLAPVLTNVDFLKRKEAPTKSARDYTDLCKLCGEGIDGNKRTMYMAKEDHVAAVHNKQHIWKCGQCKFTSHLKEDIVNHVKKEHGVDSPRPDIHIRRNATHRERKQMVDLLLECFPDTTVPVVVMNST